MGPRRPQGTSQRSDDDVVVHLAAQSDPDAEWESVSAVNVEGAYNLFAGAREAGLDRVVFASTNHVVQMYNVDDPGTPESLVERPVAVDPATVPRPDSYYAVSKVFGEALGSYYADRYGIEVVNLRIGWLHCEALLNAIDAGGAVERYARAMYLSERDCRDAVRRAVDADLAGRQLTVNVLSRNSTRYLSLTEAICGLGYEPRDDSAEVFAGG